jgi:hypothetical protein
MSRIGRLAAAWAISMSDFGLVCCEAGIAGSVFKQFNSAGFVSTSQTFI